MKIKKIINVFLSAILLMSLCTIGVFADDAKAKSMRLEDIDGEVTIQNVGGKILEVRKGGKLYSGYAIDTIEGYAWISLDDSKLIKLDWNTIITIKKNGKNLEILLENGELFFDVSKPLEEDETLNIRTSTMYTSIRGTMGIVQVKRIKNDDTDKAEKTDDNADWKEVTTTTLLEGEMKVNTTPTNKEEAEEFTLKTAQVLKTFRSNKEESKQDDDKDGDKIEEIDAFILDGDMAQSLKESPFALEELAKDETKLDRVASAQKDENKFIDDLKEDMDNVENLLADKEKETKKETQDKKTQADKSITAIKDVIPAVTPAPTEDPFVSASNPTVTASPSPSPSTSPSATPTPSPSASATPTPSPSASATPSPSPTLEPTPVPTPTLEPTAPPVTPTSCTVEFTTQLGTVFAKQVVEYNETAIEPLLMPTKAGYWSLDGATYDFTELVTSDLTLKWVAN